jgi:hypothetical protein
MNIPTPALIANFQYYIDEIIKAEMQLETKGNNVTRIDLIGLSDKIKRNIDTITNLYIDIVKIQPAFNIKNNYIPNAPAQFPGLMALMGVIDSAKRLEQDLNTKVLNDTANKLYQFMKSSSNGL